MVTITRSALGYVTTTTGYTATLQYTLTWNQTEPLVILLDATDPHTGREAPTWTISREDLALACLGIPNRRDYGDVKVERDGTTIRIHLSSPEGSAEVTMPRSLVEGIVEASGDVAPLGAEPECAWDEWAASLTR